MRIFSKPQPRLILAIIATLRVLELTIGQQAGAVRQHGFDCKMVNEVQMQRLYDWARRTPSEVFGLSPRYSGFAAAQYERLQRIYTATIQILARQSRNTIWHLL